MVLTGHQDYELIFIVNQVAEALHIATPSAATFVTMELTGGEGFCQLQEVLHLIENQERIGSWGLEQSPGDTWLASSAATYRMLLHYAAPLEDIFHGWLVDDLLPEVQGSPAAISPTDAYPDELAQLRATIRSLERRLNASTARERRLENLAGALERNLIHTTRELLSIQRKTQPADHLPSAPLTLLDRVQSEFDDLSYTWRRSVERDAAGMAAARLEDRLYRLRYASEKSRPS